jgi:hypothetical protein
VLLDPTGIFALGALVTINSLALVPEKVIAPTFNKEVPVFRIVKVLVELAVPKSVQSVIVGVESPSTIEVAFP